MPYTPHVTTVDKVVQFGLETNPGTAVAANRRMQSFDVVPGIAVSFNKHRAAGSRFLTNVIPGGESVDAAVSGIMDYGELLFALGGLFGAPSSAQQGTTAAYLHQWTPSDTVPEAPLTYTVEVGSADRAGKFAYGLFTDLSWTFDRETLPLSGRMIGQLYDNSGITLTASPTLLARKPILPNQCSIYDAAVAGSPSFTKLGQNPSGSMAIAGTHGPAWMVDASNTSFDDAIPLAPDITLSLILEANAAGVAFTDYARIMTRRILRFEAIGPVISGAYTYKLLVDMAGEVSNINAYSDAAGIYAIGFDFSCMYDSTWAKSIDIDLINTIAALS